MSFLNLLLLGGATAFLAPLMIHLLNRSRFQSVDWGAMHLLDAALQVNSRRLQWESWLLLLLRCLIPILFAVGLARPVLTQVRMMGASGEKSILLMMDTTLSMSREDQGTTAFSRSVEAASQLIGRYRAAELSLWTTGGHPQDALGGTTFDPARVQQRLARLQANAGTESVFANLSAGIEQLNRMANPSRQLVVLSDFQEKYWMDLSEAGLDKIKSQLSAGDLPIQLSLLPASELAGIKPHTQAPNLSIQISVEDGWPVFVNESYRAIGQVINHGASAVDQVQVLFEVSGRAMASRTVSVPAGGVEQVSFACEFTTPGLHAIAMEIEDVNGMAADNRQDHVVQVIDPPRVLIIDPNDDQSIGGGSGYLQLALAPFQDKQTPNSFRLAVENGSQVSAKLLEGTAALILMDVPRLDDASTQAIIDFVQHGGGLIVFAGPDLDRTWYNTKLTDLHGLLPRWFGDLKSADANEPLKLDTRFIQSPLLDIFNQNQAGDLTTLEFTQWIELTAFPESVDRRIHSQEGLDSALSLLEFTSGTPWLVGLEFGEGYVLQCATSCANDWSNMPLRPVFVPLMQRLLATVAFHTKSRHQVASGSPVLLKCLKPSGVAPNSVAIRTPSNELFKWEPMASNPLAFEQTVEPGLYRVETSLGELTEVSSLDVQPSMFSVRADPRESDSQVLNASQFAAIAERLGASVCGSVEAFVQQEQDRSHGREVWRWLVVLLVFFLFGELWLGQKITRGKL